MSSAPPLKESSAAVNISPAHGTTESPSKRKLGTPEKLTGSPAKKCPKMNSNSISGEGTVVLKEISGNQINRNQEICIGGTEKQQLRFRKISENAFQPTKGSKLSAGFDLQSAYEYTVPKRGSCLIKTDIQIQLPEGTYGRIAPRSGLALKNKIDVGAGVVDQDYRGNIGVILFNHGDEDFIVGKGDRIAQLICQKICYPEIVEVETLDSSERGADGFGSTGVKTDAGEA